MLNTQGEVLVRQLASYLDGCLGDALAALPDQARLTAPFARLATGAGALAIAALRQRRAARPCPSGWPRWHVS